MTRKETMREELDRLYGAFCSMRDHDALRPQFDTLPAHPMPVANYFGLLHEQRSCPKCGGTISRVVGAEPAMPKQKGKKK